MNNIEDEICKFARLRIAILFNIPLESIRRELVFGKELKSISSSSLFKQNEYDQIESDIYDVADRIVYREISTGKLTIRSVGDYCDHMIRCYKTKPHDVKSVLGIDE